MKKLLIGLSLVFSLSAFAEVEQTNLIEEVEISINNEISSEEKATEFHYYNFGIQFVNSYSTVRYTVTNTGTIPLDFQSARIWGTSFGASHTCRGTIMPRQRCTFTINYRPFFEGYHSGTFVLSFAQGEHIQVNLSGSARR